MTNFQEALRTVRSVRKNESQNGLAKTCGVDVAQLNRVLTGKMRPTPILVGRMVGTLPRNCGVLLLKAYLDDVVAEVAATQEPSSHASEWQTPSRLKVETTVS